MKKSFLFLVLLTTTVFSQNNFSVENLASRIRFSGDLIDMPNGEPNVGFLGHGYEVFGLLPRQKNIYFGVNSYSAITGIRSGFIVFGVSGGTQQPLVKDWLSYDVGLFLGGGGGSGAPDGGGLMIRPHLDLQADVSKKISLRAGIAAVTFPSGAIHSFNVTVGAVIHTNTYLSQISNKTVNSSDNLFFKNADIGILSMNLFNYSKGPLKTDIQANRNAPTISLLGLVLKSHQQNNFYGMLKVGGAFVGEVDGFMMLLTGLGYELPLTNWLYIDGKALVGGAGGGNVQFGGGLATQLEAGIGINISDYLLSVNYGKTYAPNGSFQSNHLDVAIGKKFDLFHTDHKEVVVSGSEVVKEDFSFSTFNRTYVSGDLKDKNGRNYDTAFNLIGFELEKKINKNLSILATTVWAYQGHYGAYAEGWVGLQYYYHLANNWNVSAKGLLGAGGGGAINLGSGMAYNYMIGAEKQVNKRWSVIGNIGQVRPVTDGNFTPLTVDFGVKLNINQLVRK